MKCSYRRFLLPVFPIHFSPVLSSPAPTAFLCASWWASMWTLHLSAMLCCAYLRLLGSSSQASFPGFSLSLSGSPLLQFPSWAGFLILHSLLGRKCWLLAQVSSTHSRPFPEEPILVYSSHQIFTEYIPGILSRHFSVQTEWYMVYGTGDGINKVWNRASLVAQW